MTSFIHTLRVHYVHAEVNLNSGYSKYAKVTHALFLYNCTVNISRSADARVSVDGLIYASKELHYLKLVIILCV